MRRRTLPLYLACLHKTSHKSMGVYMDELFDEEQRKIQKSLNQARKRELAEKYGARFSEESDLDPDIESKWLDSIEAYERQYKDSRRVSVRGFVGRPPFQPLGEGPAGGG